MRVVLLAVALVLALCAPATCQEKSADWIGIQSEDAAAPKTVVYHKSFGLDFSVDQAYLKFTCHTPMDFGGTQYRGFVNGFEGARGSFWEDVQYIDASGVLHKGGNSIDIEVTWVPNGVSGPILVKLVAVGKDEEGDERSVTIRSDETWTYTIGKFDITHIVTPSGPGKKVTVAGPADSWEHAKSPLVLPKINTSTVVGVTDVGVKGGNAGSLYQFNLVRDYSDKFYFLKPLGYQSVEDYIFGQANYKRPGQWFWGYDRKIAHNQEIAGFDFTVYPWVWVPAEWYRREHNPVMARCLEHNQEGFGISLWSPRLIKLNEDMYADLKANLGLAVKFVYPGIYGDFGEAHYMAGWNPWMQPEPEHQHPGFWSGDDLAVADFRNKMLGNYGTLEALNAAWGSHYSSQDEIAYPRLDGSDRRRRTLDFVNWYYDCMTDFTARVCAIAKKHFPDVLIAPKLGCGDENPMWGQDNSAICEALSENGVGVRSTHGSSPNFAVRRISSACKLYGNDFETETAGGTNRNDAVKKFFIDASNGCSAIFEYPNAMLEVADIFSQCRRHLRGEHPITEVALFFPTSWHRCNLRVGYPPKIVQAAEEIRDILDFDVVDENMVLDGALAGYRVLAMFDGDFTEQVVYDAISDWVDNGGTLLMLSDQLPFTNVEGDQLPPTDLAVVAKSGEISRDQGNGRITVWTGELLGYYNIIHGAAFPDSARGIDGKSDGVWSSLFKDHALYLNNTASPVTVSEDISEDFARRVGLHYRPEYLKYSIQIPAKSIVAHFFDKPSVEFALECEEMDGADKHPIDAIHKGGCGAPGRVVRVAPDNYLRTRFRVEHDAVYAFCCLVDGGSAQLEIDGRKVADIQGPAGPHGYMYPPNAKLRLKRGEHLLILRFGKGRHLADKVMVTTDTDLAGFAYGFIDPKADQSW